MKRIKNTLLASLMLTVIGIGSVNSNPQSKGPGDPDAEPKSKTIKINRGQVLDFLNAIRNPGTDDAMNEYFGKVFPPAQQYGFKLDATFVTVAPPTQGNYHAQFFGVSSWTSKESRAKWDNHKMDYDFKQARREIWSVFNLVYYKNLKDDIEFTVSDDKLYVITSYWIDDMKAFKKASNKTTHSLVAAGGKKILSIGKGESPIGYQYEPDVITITEWETHEAFDQYLVNNNISTKENGVKNVQQLKTQALLQ
jgi:heme-degrading monooxygenase HmoA